MSSLENEQERLVQSFIMRAVALCARDHIPVKLDISAEGAYLLKVEDKLACIRPNDKGWESKAEQAIGLRKINGHYVLE